MNSYRVMVSYSEAKKSYIAQAPELEHCQAEGATRAEALARLEEEISAQLENMQAQGVEIPRPLDASEFDGNLTLKVSGALHRELVFLARAENVELETLLVELLSRAVSQRWSGGRGGGGRPRGEGRPRREEGTGSRYHNIMENRADFIEYVRSLETGGGRGGGGGGGRGGPRGGRR